MTLVGLVQLNSGPDTEENIRAIASAIERCARRGADVVVLPEAAIRRGGFDLEHVHSWDGAVIGRLTGLARAADLTLVVGGIWTPGLTPQRPFNSQLVIDARGLRGRYDKVHLFKLHVPGLVDEDEALHTTPGDHLILLDLVGLRWGLSTCYDIRFPELYRALRLAGADVFTVPSNFSSVTGPHHWEALLRARAIENLCYVLAPAQCGTDPTGFQSHGSTMAIDPWGRVIAELGSSPGELVVDITPEAVADARSHLMSPDHIRPEAYVVAVVDGSDEVER